MPPRHRATRSSRHRSRTSFLLALVDPQQRARCGPQHPFQPVGTQVESRQANRVGARTDTGIDGKSLPSTTRPASPRSRNSGNRSLGNGIPRSVKSVKAIVVSSTTDSKRDARSRKSPYLGMPACATTSRSRGCRASTSPIGPTPVYGPGTGPSPQCTTTGNATSVSKPQTSSSNGSRGSYLPTSRCDLKMRAPRSTASCTYAATPGSGKNVADGTTCGTAAACENANSFSHSAICGLCG